MNARRSLRILSLEDSELDAELIFREVKLGGFEFSSFRTETRSGFERAIREFQPDVILADYKLPGFNGAEALAIARQMCPDVPVIVISGAVGEEIAVELLKNGATDFVLKDRLGRLSLTLRRALRECEEREALRRAEAQLRELNEHLEQLVLERTQTLREKNALMEEELAMARELQIAILPHHFPTLPWGVAEAESALRFCNIYRPAASVSGDFFNVVRVSDTAVGILICDVMGHDVRAALVASMIRALEEQLRETADDPGKLLTEINRAMCAILQQTGTTIFSTAFYLIIDIATTQIRFANAAHPSPLLVQHGPDRVSPISTRPTTGPVLGILEAAVYHTHECSISEGDLVLLFTDGLFEVENRVGEVFSEVRLRNLILQKANLPPPLLMQKVFSDIEQFAVGQIFSDDVCLVGIEIARLHPGCAPNHSESVPARRS